jgi:hypothetical protein
MALLWNALMDQTRNLRVRIFFSLPFALYLCTCACVVGSPLPGCPSAEHIPGQSAYKNWCASTITEVLLKYLEYQLVVLVTACGQSHGLLNVT